MHFEVISEENKWNDFLNKFRKENKDVYFSYTYVKSHDKNKDGLARCSIFEGENGMKIIYPFIITRIPDYGLNFEYFDISSCYGYGGPLIEDYNETDRTEFEKLFHIWCVNNSIVAEFIRFHPIINNHKIFKEDIIVEKNRNTVLIDIDRPIEDVWNNSVNSKNRNQIRKAKKTGIKIIENNNMDNFLEIYSNTMKRLQADDYFYFNNDYYNELLKLIPDNMVVLEAIFEKKVIASSLFMYMGENIHYHLSGSICEYMNLCPNNLMVFYGIEYGINKGLKRLHLGGGTTNQEDDSLLRFKKGFSRDLSEFYIGKRIHNKEIYKFLINKWEEKNNIKAEIFLQYEVI
jgi:hypothetical protein